MTQPVQLETPRLILRRWQEADRAPFAAMNADPIVMHFFAAPMTMQQSDETVDRYLAGFEKNGFSFFVATLRETGTFAGIIGLQVMRDLVPNLPQPAVEIGWRLTRECQGLGLATEGASAIVDYAFDQLGLAEVVAIVALPNRASRRVMEKLGMKHRPELDFNHPRVPADHPYLRHTLYSLRNSNFPEVPCSIPS
jgi:RimJ/RimL family protein N-acetyltransferase